MENVAVFIKNYSIGKSSPVLCMLDLLAVNYDAVDIYGQNVGYLNATVMEKKNIRFIDVPVNKKGLISALFSFFKSDTRPEYNSTYNDFIAFDPHGFVLCMELFPESHPIYYSLELYFRDNHFNLTYPPDVFKRERAWINNIKGLIIQSEERERFFRNEYNISNEIPTFMLPVTYLQPSDNKKSEFLRKKYDIADEKKMVLHLGGIQEYHSCIELALYFATLNDYVLIFHGYHFGQYIEKLLNIISCNGISNVIVSDEVFERIEDMDLVLRSCDIGIAWYNNVSPNFATAGKSSGKISAYLRFGLPVISNRYSSTIDAIEKTGCGICVDAFDEISEGVRKIVRDYDRYSENCRREYDEVYWFDNYRKKLIEFIGQEEQNTPLIGRH